MCAALLVLTVGMAFAAAPPARLAPEQAKRIADRDLLAGEFIAAMRAGQNEKALVLLHQHVALSRRVLGPWHRDVEMIANLGSDLHRSRGEWRKEAECLRIVAEARRVLYGAGHHLTIDSVLSLDEAMAEEKRTPAQRRTLQNAKSLVMEAIALHGKGQSARAVPLARQSLELRRAVLGERHLAYVRSLNNLAAILQGANQSREGLPLSRRALGICDALVGKNHPEYAWCLEKLAMLLRDLGDDRAALPLLQEARAIRKRTSGPLDLDYARTLNNLAVLYQDSGDLAAALPLSRQSHAIHKQALGEKHAEVATCLNNLALLLKDMSRPREALPLCRQALAIRKDILGPNHPGQVTSLNCLADILDVMGDHKAALPYCEQALAITRTTRGKQSSEYASALGRVARQRQFAGDFESALPLFQEARAIHKEVQGEKHPDYALSLMNLACLHEARRDRKAAIPLADESLTLSAAYLRSLAAVLSDRQQLAATVALRHRLDFRLSMMDEGCYAHALVWKGAVLLGQRQRRLHSALSSDPATLGLASRLRDVARRIALLASTASPPREDLMRLGEEQERLQARLSGLSAVARAAFSREANGPQSLAKALPENAALVDYLYYRHFGHMGTEPKPRLQFRFAAFVSRKGRPTVRVELGPAKWIEDAVRSWQPLIAARKHASAEGARLKELVWTPLAKHLEGMKVVLISPDRMLATVPFAALPGKKEGTYLIEEMALGVVPVPQLLPELVVPRHGAKRLAPSLLVVGGVDYGRATARRGEPGTFPGARRDWGALPGTAEEADAVAVAFAGLFKDGKITALGKERAGKEAVCEALAKVRCAHLATHGFFAPPTVRSAFSPDASSGLFSESKQAGWPPLLLSGLVFAGANRDPGPAEEDGVLTALEVSEMALPGLEMVVLSACETGLGEFAGGEGLLGMQRAFAAAGLCSVMASLWQVDDLATQRLMSDFYSLAWDAKSTVSKAEALRKAQLAMLFGKTLDGKPRGLGKATDKLPMGDKERLPPYYWAAFVLSGDWR